MLIIFPLQQLKPIHYTPRYMDFIFYVLFFLAIVFSSVYLMQTTRHKSWLSSLLRFPIAILLISIHVVIVSGYSTTLTLTAASVLEDRHDFTKAKRIYESYLPHIRHDNLLAALYHR